VTKLVTNVSPCKGDGLEPTVEPDDEDIALFKEVEFRPTKDYPKARHAGMVGDQICFEHKQMLLKVTES
jgi:hypothetical protein